MTGLTDLLDLVVCASNPRIGKVEVRGLEFKAILGYIIICSAPETKTDLQCDRFA